MYSREEEERWLKLGETLGFKIHMTATALCVKTNKSSWHISLVSKYIKLYHTNFFHIDNRRQKYMNNYHKQNLSFNSVEDALYYIYRHDKKRFTSMEQKVAKVEDMFSLIRSA